MNRGYLSDQKLHSHHLPGRGKGGKDVGWYTQYMNFVRSFILRTLDIKFPIPVPMYGKLMPPNHTHPPITGHWK
jgi:hypothetical protein